MEMIFENECDEEFDRYEEVFHDLALYTLRLLQKNENISLEVNLVSQETIHEINREYRSIDRPTDVISFAFLDEMQGEIPIKSDDVMILLGEILISVTQARLQSLQYGHSLHRELCFLFVHGMLHLLGYDHQTPDEEKIMFDLQEKILKEKEILR